MVTRRVYDDAGRLLREQLTPKDVPNRREDLLAYWQAEDERIAAEEAAAAQAEADRLAAMAQEPANESMAIPALVSRVDEAEAALDQHADLIAQLGDTIDGLTAATPEEIIRVGVLLTGASAAALAVEGAAEKAIGEIQSVSDEARQSLDDLNARSVEHTRQVADLVTGARQQLQATQGQVVADSKKAVSQLITTATARIADLRGPRGAVGAAGASTVIGSGRPEGPSVMEALIGRGAVVGDCLIDGSDNDRRAYRWDGQSWEPGPAMATVQVRDVKISALDNSTKNYPTVTASATGGGGGTGGEPLLVNRATLNVNQRIADSSNWAGVSDPTAGQLVVEIVALDGALAGRRGFACIDFVWQPTGAQDSQGGLLGDLAGVFDLNLSYQRIPASAPAGITITIPTAAQALQVFATIVPTPGGTGTGSVTQFRVSGDLEWAHQSLGQAVPISSNLGIKPLWRWV